MQIPCAAMSRCAAQNRGDSMNVTKRIGLSIGGVATSLGLPVSGLAASAPANADGTQRAAEQSTMDGRSPDALRCRPPFCYGAIALAKRDTKVGLAYRSSSKRSAFHNALSKCRRQSSFRCIRVTWVRNDCAAIAIKSAGRQVDKYGWATGFRHHRPAVRAAKRKCERVRPVGRPCLKTAWVCTRRNL